MVGSEAKTLAPRDPRGFVFTSQAEEQFYLSNNLPERLRDLFKNINPRRLDEDLLEELCGRAQKLVLDAALLEDFISMSYTAFKNVGFTGSLVLRRPSGVSQHLETASNRREMLLALKRLWAHDWAFGSVLKRLDSNGGIGLDASAVYVLEAT